MIKRKRAEIREQQIDREETKIDSYHRRKGSVGRVNRFNYAVDSIMTDEGNENSHSRDKRYKPYPIFSTENQPSLQNNLLQHQPSRLLKKDYLYGVPNQSCKRILNERDLNISYEFHQLGQLNDREDFKNCSYEMKATKNSPYSNQKFLSNSCLKRNPLSTDNNVSCLDITDQSAINTSNLDCSRSEEALELQYQQIYANNQRQKRKSICKQMPSLQLPPERTAEQSLIVNSKAISSKNTVLNERLHSAARVESSSGNNTQRNTSINQISTSKDMQMARAMETRKGSPRRLDCLRTRHISELATLRTSPAKIVPTVPQIDSNLKLIDQFSLRVSSKLQELTVLLQSVRLMK